MDQLSKNLDIFQKLVGKRCLRNCVLVTTKWAKVNKEYGEKREEELLSDGRFWKNMVANEARVARFDGSPKSAMKILQSIAGLEGILPYLAKELCVDRKPLKDTKAGKVASVELREVGGVAAPLVFGVVGVAEAKYHDEKEDGRKIRELQQG